MSSLNNLNSKTSSVASTSSTVTITNSDNSNNRRRRLPILLFDVMDTIVRDPFYQDVPAFFRMSLKELIECKHPTAWIEFEKGLINEVEMRTMIKGTNLRHDDFPSTFLFERLTNYAKPHAILEFKSSLDQATRTVAQVPNDMSRALRWKGKGTSKSLAQFIDVEEAFIFRPYAYHLLGEVDLMLHPRDVTPIDMKEDDIPILACLWGAIYVLFCLPILNELGDMSMIYNPHRVTR
ncbi:hypothetical protein F0562_025612 [Nyssa sinensis]|uniref:Uncharacterized protein n=1 Tax=Nyssa sinensis TaxID=561372 RepID=A0A5J5B8Z0_9ASTE|nr:hypothetical protein F0562_025612 [Nyssa sinensis]